MTTKETSNFQILKEELTKLSVSDNWDDVKREWKLVDVYFNDQLSTCLCSHYPIREICVIQNTLNRKEAEIGNRCIEHFMGFAVSLIFEGLKRIEDNKTAACNQALIYHAYEKKWINEWEMKFLTSTVLKRKLSGKQRRKRIQINENILWAAQKTKGNRRK